MPANATNMVSPPPDTAAHSARVAPQPLALHKNISWTFFGNYVYFATQWGILVALAKIGSPEFVGLFGLAMAVVAPIMTGASLQLRSVLATDSTRKYGIEVYLALRLLTTGLALVVIAGFAFFGPYAGHAGHIILAIGVAKGFEAISDIIYGLLLRHERMDRIAQLQMVKGVASLIAVVSVLYYTGSVLWACAAMAGVWAACLLLLDLPSATWALGQSRLQALSPRWTRATLLKIAWTAAPLGCGMLLMSLSVGLPCYFVEYHLGTRQLGIFVAIASFMKVGNNVFASLGQSAGPRLARHHAEGRTADFRSVLLKMLALGFAIGVLGVVLVAFAGRHVLSLFFTAEYARHAGLFVLLMLATTISFHGTFEHALIASKSYRKLLVFWGCHVVLLAALLAVLIPIFELSGAAYAILSANLVRLVVMWAIFSRPPYRTLTSSGRFH